MVKMVVLVVVVILKDKLQLEYLDKEIMVEWVNIDILILLMAVNIFQLLVMVVEVVVKVALLQTHKALGVLILV